jgi:hypothetical protein
MREGQKVAAQVQRAQRKTVEREALDVRVAQETVDKLKVRESRKVPEDRV